MILDKDIMYLKGVGEKRSEYFKKLNIFTIYDLLNTFPRSYEDRTKIFKISDCSLEEYISIIATVTTAPIKKPLRNRKSLITFNVCDESDNLKISVFGATFGYDKIKEGEKYLFYGKVMGNMFLKQMTNPQIMPILNKGYKGEIVPIYSLTKGLSMEIYRKTIKGSLISIEELLETLPQNLLTKYNLTDRQSAYLNIHFPKDFNSLEMARKRLVFEELLTLQLGMYYLKKRNRNKTSISLKNTNVSNFIDSLEFKPTNAQNRVISDCILDMQKSIPMNRLIQGDVGSGKTMVAAATAFAMIREGYSVCLMVPTEILALQHFKYFTEVFEKFNINCCLLTGSTKGKEKKQILKDIEDGKAKMIIGTHALISEGVNYNNLGLIITDEQHRFGVNQRASLINKGKNPHTLVMSATPIPRTLGLIMYGDLDISIIDEMPPGRQKVDTFLIDNKYRKRMHSFILKALENKNQVYIVCPLVEMGDDENLKDATNYTENMKKIFKDYNISLIHGKLKDKEKDLIMSEFSKGKIDILVSTTVIEVGVNVPNATLMIIENAERFGLSQLHQLRGRVGRGSEKSYCILVSDAKNEITKSRLNVMTKENDGFKIAKEDLALRGPGDFFGSRQHGLPPLKIANLSLDAKILEDVSKASKTIIENDSDFKNKSLINLYKGIEKMFSGENINIFN